MHAFTDKEKGKDHIDLNNKDKMKILRNKFIENDKKILTG